MTEEIDKSGVIESLTNGIGAKLGRAARSSFYEMLDRLEKLPAYRTYSPSLKQHIIDILALSVIYTQIVVPLESGQGFLDLAKTAGATHVRMGKDQIDSSFNRQSSKCTRMFYALVNEANIPITLLSFSTLKDLSKNISLIHEAREA